jgi:hypothetical protein
MGRARLPVQTGSSALPPALLSFFFDQLVAEGLVAVELVEEVAGENPGDEKQTKEDRADGFWDVVQSFGAEVRKAEADTDQAQQQKEFRPQVHTSD